MSHTRIRRTLVASLAIVPLLFGLAACAPTTGAAEAGTISVSDSTVILDVRTAEEFATGHLEGAELHDFSGGQLAADAPNLDKTKEYLVYCRSGNRSAQATSLLKSKGFTDVTDLGAMESAASATGLEIVQ